MMPKRDTCETAPKSPVVKDLAQVPLFGLSLSNARMPAAVDWLIQRTRSRQKTLLNFVNAHCVNIAHANPAYRHALAQSDALFPDGSGISLALRLQGLQLRENLNGTDIFPHLCEQARERHLSVYLLGGREGVATQVAENMCRQFPGLRIAGTQHGYFSERETDRVIARINRSEADILLVAMGVPRQELWLQQHGQRLNAPLQAGVGGLFDFYSERISRAPLWLRRVGAEWIWRLIQEPGRMWRRYLLGNPVFLLRAVREALRTRARQAVTANPLGRRVKAFLSRLRWRMGNAGTRLGRRALDIIVSGSALLLLSPLLLLTVVAIRLESPGSVFFAQQRIGLRGTPFRLWKFRSMYLDAEARKAELMAKNEMQGGVLFKMHNDPRVTRVGRFIRRFSIDELPQLWNVLRGDMALVGPRPALPDEVAQYDLPQRHRLLARPGITCTWQVSGRSRIPFEQQVAMDVEYIHRASLGTDVQLLIKTVPAVISGDGAY